MDFWFGPTPIVWVQQAIGYGHGGLFRFLSLFGTTWGVLFAVSLALWLWDRTDAYAVIGVVLVEVATNLLINQLIGIQRPEAPAVVKYVHVPLPSFPSGHVYTAAVVWGLLAARGRIRYWVAAVLVLTTAVARLYLGTHYLADVLVGALLGGLLVWAWTRTWPWLEARLSRLSYAWIAVVTLILVATAGFLATWKIEGEHVWRALGLAAGGAVALLLEYRFIRYEARSYGVLRRVGLALIGISGIALAYAAEQFSATSAYRLTGVLLGLGALWGLLIAPTLFAATALAPGTEARRAATVRWWGRAAAMLAAAVLLLLGYGFAIEPRLLLDVEVEPAPVAGLPAAWQGARIAVAGDFQVGLVLDNTGMVTRTVERLVELRPDAVVLLGDFIYRGGRGEDEIAHVMRLLRPLLRSGIPVFAVLGNHDWGMAERTSVPDSARAARVRAALEAAGARVLQNEAVALERGGAALHLVGLVAAWPGGTSPGEAFSGVPPAAPRVVAMHNPASFPGLPAGAAPVAFAGHTHGGQVRLPLTPEWSWLTFTKEDPVHADGWVEQGLGAAGNRLYINRGIGMSVLPLRLNCRPEITVFVLERASAPLRTSGTVPRTTFPPRG